MARFLTAILAALFVAAAGVWASGEEHGDAPVHWGYGEEDGPARWGSLKSDWSLCGTGISQSPVDLGKALPAEGPKVVRRYRPASLQIIHHEHVVDVLNNGHTIQVNYDEGSTLQVGDAHFELLQYHFHAPSEHTVDGKHFPMEMHLVHKGPDGSLAVLGVLIEAGSHQPAFEPVWKHFPAKQGELQHLEHVSVDVDELLPADRHAYRYRGSLTTPPCSEDVSWIVFSKPLQLSKQQIDAFVAIVTGNNRPIQPLGQRTVLIGTLD